MKLAVNTYIAAIILMAYNKPAPANPAVMQGLKENQTKCSLGVQANPKKGLGIYRQQNFPNVTQKLHLAWYYTWGLSPIKRVPANVEFVPMVWGWYGDKSGKVTQQIVSLKSRLKAHYLLGFNEPDNATQSNLSVAAALKAWPVLMKAHLPLGAPGAVHADDVWMRQFMAEAEAAHDRVDFVPIHWYGLPDAQAFLNYVRHIHELYGKPVWITEFANVDWSSPKKVSSRFTANDVAKFLRVVLPALNQMSYVVRYAWFSSLTPPLSTSSLFNKDGSLTEAGRVYASN